MNISIESWANLDKGSRIKSYDFIEDFVSRNVHDWNKAPDTEAIEKLFTEEIEHLDNTAFSFLLCHNGYIPEFYGHDSSQETLFSKLIESLVCEWAKRIGFRESILQKQKSNKEDITIRKDNLVIVCDAKSFRLGRSQAAPNVKDTVKKAAYLSWLDQYDSSNRVGGLITFPSLHDWQRQSEAYKYFTEGAPPIMLLFYEQLSFLLINGYSEVDIITFMKKYNEIFPVSSEKRHVYEKGLVDNLFSRNIDEYNRFQSFFSNIIKEKVSYTIQKIDDYLLKTRVEIERDISNMTEIEIQNIAINTLYENKCKQLVDQKENIIKFRPHFS